METHKTIVNTGTQWRIQAWWWGTVNLTFRSGGRRTWFKRSAWGTICVTSVAVVKYHRQKQLTEEDSIRPMDPERWVSIMAGNNSSKSQAPRQKQEAERSDPQTTNIESEKTNRSGGRLETASLPSVTRFLPKNHIS